MKKSVFFLTFIFQFYEIIISKRERKKLKYFEYYVKNKLCSRCCLDNTMRAEISNENSSKVFGIIRKISIS